MNNGIQCPICLYERSCQRPRPGLFECDICGKYKINNKLEVPAPEYDTSLWNLNPLQRAVLSYRIRTESDASSQAGSDPFEITSEVLDSLRSNGSLPSPAVQATNIVRFIGDEVSRSGEAVNQLPENFHAIIGSLNYEAAIRLTKELVDRKTLIADPPGTAVGSHPVTGRPFSSFTNINLSLDGWEQYEAEKRGRFAGNYGFLAMQFNDPDLESFVREVVKPAVKEATGSDLVDMRDVGRAGIIDNIMRVRIRDAKFVIADLTHGNNGAYWEAGYAEGLGKPVIYICEKEKFESKDGPHFDTNHCTTVFWSKYRDNDEDFRQKLTATLRRSLDES